MTRSSRFRSPLAAAVLAAGTLAAAAPSEAGPFFFFKFTPIADTKSGFPFEHVDPFPSINTSGMVAFSGRLTGGVQGVFTRQGLGGIHVLSDSGVSEFFMYGIETSINSHGVVAFVGLEDLPDRRGVALLRGEGHSATRLINESNNLSDFCGIQISNEDSVVFRAARADGTHEIRAQGGQGGLTGVFRLIAEEGSEFSDLGCPSIDFFGNVAFTAVRQGQRAIFRRAALDGALTQLISATNSPFAFFGDVMLTQTGGLAFMGRSSGGFRTLNRLRNGELTQIASTGPEGFPNEFSINESGRVAFQMSREANGSSLHVGPGTLFGGRVIGTGNVVFNDRFVSNVHISRGALNSLGQIVMQIITGPDEMIVRADPVFAPDFVLTTGGLLTTTAQGGTVTVGTTWPGSPRGSSLTFDLTFLSLGGQLDVKLGNTVVQSFRAREPGVRHAVSIALDPRLGKGDLQFVMSGQPGASAQLSAIRIPELGEEPLNAEALARWKINDSGGGVASVIEVARYPMRARLKGTYDPRRPGITLVQASVISDENVDASADLNLSSLRVAGVAPRQCAASDVNGDTLVDLTCEVELPESAISHEGPVSVEAMTPWGWAIEGLERIAAPRLK